MGLFSKNKPKIKVQTTKKDGYSGWVKCTHCHEMIHANELEQNLHCCPKCNYHYRLSGLQRMEMLVDKGSFVEMFTEFKSMDPLQFVDTEAYPKRIASAQKSSGRDEAALVGSCSIEGHKIALGILDFSFMAGSMGSVVGERLTSLAEFALEKKLPLVIVSASGGARMQESILSLMQMAKTSAALAKLHEQKIPYISSRLNYDGTAITAIPAIPHNPNPEADRTEQRIEYGSSPRITRLDGFGNGNRSLEFTSETLNEILEKIYGET